MLKDVDWLYPTLFAVFVSYQREQRTNFMCLARKFLSQGGSSNGLWGYGTIS